MNYILFAHQDFQYYATEAEKENKALKATAKQTASNDANKTSKKTQQSQSQLNATAKKKTEEAESFKLTFLFPPFHFSRILSQIYISTFAKVG